MPLPGGKPKCAHHMATTKYLLAQKADLQWGVITKTVGMQDARPGCHYPVGEHPEDYFFLTDKGRVLHEAQVVYILKGCGWFVSAHMPRTTLHAGDSIVLYPGEWHNYAPDPRTGWSEAWIGFSGSLVEPLLNKFFPDRSQAILHIGLSDSLLAAFEKALEIAEDQLPAYQQQLAGYVALIVSSIYAKSRQRPYLDNPHYESIVFATKLMRQHLGENLNMEDVARQAGMGYSKFRKLFRDYTGFAPAQYFLRLKIERAKDLLLSTSLSCKEISFRLGFDSASHFGKMFRTHQGQTPADFRAAPYGA